MEIWLSIIMSIIRAGTPLLLGTLGQIAVERTGVLNLGTEGIMIIGAVTGFAIARATGNPWLGLAAAALAGMTFALIHGTLSITFRGNQTVSGLALTMLGLGLSGLMGRNFVGIPAVRVPVVPLYPFSEIPLIGQLLFNYDPLVYLSYVLVPAFWFVLYRTKVGIIVRAVGDSPETADSMGISVYKVRYLGVMVGGLLIGLAGAYLSLVYIPAWIEGMTAGRGWIVIALAVFAMWDPLRALVGAYLFGGVEVLQYHLQPYGISPAILGMTPYIATIVVLCIASRETFRRRLGAPKSLGKSYIREE